MNNLEIINQIATVMKHMTTVVDKEGHDHVYTRTNDTCLYARNGEPDCLIGRVLHRMGWSIRTLELMGDHNIDYAFVGILGSDSRPPFVLFSQTIQVMRAAQRVQDAGNTWGLALGMANKEAYNIIRVLSTAPSDS